MSGLMPLPGSGEVHLWLVQMRDFMAPPQQEQLRQWLALDELRRVERLQFPLHRQRACVSRGLLRHILSLYHPQQPPASWQLRTSAHGRPLLVDSGLTPLHFNVSHSGDRLAIVFARHGVLGVDVEQVVARRHLRAIARRHFSAQEIAWFESLDAGQQTQRFFDLWTLKEAYIKARGLGLAIPLQQFSFELTAGAGIRAQFDSPLGEDGLPWVFRLYDLPGARLAVAVQLQDVTPDLLITCHDLQAFGQWRACALQAKGST
ncbi:MAG: hypothetical protein RLZZ385_242 [Pseudomonadota bacterium]|jgi:4'-phosphopantetheinyl transferase